MSERDDCGNPLLSIAETRMQVLSDMLMQRKDDVTNVVERAIRLYVRALLAIERPNERGEPPPIQEVSERLWQQAAVWQRAHEAMRVVAARYAYEVRPKAGPGEKASAQPRKRGPRTR